MIRIVIKILSIAVFLLLAAAIAGADDNMKSLKDTDPAGGPQKPLYELYEQKVEQTDTYKQSGGGAPKERTVAPAGHGLRLIVGDVYKPSPDNGLEKK